MVNTIKIKIYKDPSRPEPSIELSDIPWYAGITVLQAMIIGEAQHADNFSFHVKYRSIFGAQIDSIDDTTDNVDIRDHYWFLYINGDESRVGASEAILLEDDEEAQTVIVEWKYLDISGGPSSQFRAKTRSLN